MTGADLVSVLGHLLLGGIFVFAGLDHFMNFRKVEGLLAAHRWPAPAAWLALASVFQIVAGLCLATGVLRAPAAFALAAFTVAASVLLVDFWKVAGPERQGLRSVFLVNVGLTSGLLAAAAASL